MRRAVVASCGMRTERMIFEEEDITLTLIQIASIGLLIFFLRYIWIEISRRRSDMIPERYPFEKMIEILANQHRSNDYFSELWSSLDGRKYSIKIFVSFVVR
jgi:hypothetical protein